VSDAAQQTGQSEVTQRQGAGDATTHALYSFTLTVLGRFVEAIAEQKQALELDPVSANTNWNVGYVFFVARQYDQAIEQLRKTQELGPNFLPAHVTLGWAYVEKSMYKDGIAELDKVLAMAPGNTRALSRLGYAYAVTGTRGEAQKVLNQLNALSAHKYVPAIDMADIYAGLGEKDKAFEWLEKGYEERSLAFGDIKVDPAFDPLRSDPRFADLLRRMNLQP
jgi:tetratricopeptide (TPR) repeat protein